MIDANEDDLIMLETLVKSPAFAALKRCLEGYRKQCYSVLTTSKESHEIFQTQGRIIGVGVIENLPSILVARKQEALKRVEEKRNKEKEFQRKRERILNPEKKG